METKEKLIYDTKKLMLARYPRFGSDIAAINIEYNKNLKYKTAETDGKKIYIDPDYFESLSEEDRLFTIAHEIMHIKFNHIARLIDKNGKKRNLKIWNEATDAIINANLERDGFKIKKGYINRPEALQYTAEEYYEILLNKPENQTNSDNDSKDNNNNHQVSNHNLWESASEKERENENNKQQDEPTQSNNSSEEFFDEKSEFTKNRDERKNRAKENLERMRAQMLSDFTQISQPHKIQFGDVGESQETIDWKILLRREIEQTETIWSQRRSVAENNYAYRLEENELEEGITTEVIIDISESVDIELVKAFLRILKQMLRYSKLKVGCFNTAFYNFVDVKNNEDINNLIYEVGGGTDYNLAVSSFTKNRREINKIIFTDGGLGNMPNESLKHENIIWIVYGNKDFKPCCGKVINITEKQLETISLYKTDTKGKTK